MQAFVEKAGLSGSLGGSPPPSFIHVAGTNGKGSVTAFLQSMLVEHGFRTGAFFSPYVVDPRERVQLGRSLIPEQDFAEIVDYLRPIAETFSQTEFGGITEFEFKAAVGFEYWRRSGCEWVALEVGLGGRLDATNVVTSKCSVIVSIGYDHTQILGNTLREIAREKAGIIKPGVPVVVGEMPDEARDTILSVASEIGSPAWCMGAEIHYRRENGCVLVETPWQDWTVRPSLAGSIQAHNVAVALSALSLALDKTDPDAAERGAARAYLPGRFQAVQIRGIEAIADGAHNAEAARVLAAALRAKVPGQRYALVAGMTAGHEPAVFFKEIQSLLAEVHSAPIDFHRAQPPEVVAQAAAELGLPSQTHPSLEQAVEAALRSGHPILVTGSFYLVGDFLRRFEQRA